MSKSGQAPKSKSGDGGHFGFTLIELLSVIAIISILMSLIIGLARFAKLKAMEARARADMEQLANTLGEYSLDNGLYPNDLNDIIDELPSGVSIVDPWGGFYVYETPSDRLSYDLYCDGRLQGNPADDFRAER